MAKMTHSEAAARIAIEGVVAALAGTVTGKLGLTPRELGEREKIDLALNNVGRTLYYELDQTSGVFVHSDNAFTTVWYGGADVAAGIRALDGVIQHYYPDAKQVADYPHETERGFNKRTYDIRLPNDTLAVVDAIYPTGRVDNPKFMVRVTAMVKQQR